MEQKIAKYIMEVLKGGGRNAMDLADEVFGKDPIPSSEGSNLVVEELAEIASVKRQLVIDIVKKKTGFNLGMSKDSFTDGIVLLIDKGGEKVEDRL